MTVLCSECSKTFSTQSSYNRHRREFHGLKHKILIPYEYESTMFKCEECRVSFKKNEFLRYHLSRKHNMKFDCEELSFRSYEEFQCWLSMEEKAKNIEFKKVTGIKRSNSETNKIYLNCVRSGKAPEPISDRKRALKSQGSKKINHNCTSQIIVDHYKCGECKVLYYKTHYGHSHDVEHLKIYNSRKASKLLLGVSTEKILDNSEENEKISHSAITKNDIKTVKQTYNIDIRSGCRHVEDAESVDMWIKEVEMQDDNPVLFYKKQGELSDNQLIESDFCLILMNDLQASMLRKYGSNFVCLDNTHGLKPNEFELTTLMIIDEFGEGFPVSCMFSNRKDIYINELFFMCVKKKVGTINPKTLMADITDTYFNAWCCVMGIPDNRLFCSWHVDSAWQHKLKVKISEKRKGIYKTLRNLQRIPECEKFEDEYAAFIRLLFNENNMEEIGLYLEDHYSSCTEAWAYCYRKRWGIPSNMLIENMHKNLRHTYLEGKKVKRVDKSLHLLQKLIRDKIINRLIKGQTTNHSQQINVEHNLALTLDAEVILESSNQFFIKISNTESHYVTKMHDYPCCKLKCGNCNVCIHTFDCTCLDFNIKNIICRHIHCICLQNLAIAPYQVKHNVEPDLVDDYTQSLPSNSPYQERIEVEPNLVDDSTQSLPSKSPCQRKNEVEPNLVDDSTQNLPSKSSYRERIEVEPILLVEDSIQSLPSKSPYHMDNEVEPILLVEDSTQSLPSKSPYHMDNEVEPILLVEDSTQSLPLKLPYQKKNEVELILLVDDSTQIVPLMSPKDQIIKEIETNLLEVISDIKSGTHSDQQLLFILRKSKNIKNVINILNTSFLYSNGMNVKEQQSNKNIPKQSIYSSKKRK